MKYDQKLEEELRIALESYLATTPVFSSNKSNAMKNGYTVDDNIEVNLKDVCGKPTAILCRRYFGGSKTPSSHVATFEFARGRDAWQVSCSSGYPSADRD